MSPRSPARDRLAAAITVLDADIERRMGQGYSPGLAIAITDRDGLLYERGYGLAEVASGRPVEPETWFEIGSIGKTFTALVVMQLAEEGRLSIDDVVVRHLPWFRVPRTGGRITIHHLLSHTAGITAGVDGTPEASFQVWRLRDLAPGAAPGRRFHYSNVGYKTLGLVIEAIEGEPYPAVLQRRILDPLGMISSHPAITNDTRPRLAVGYEPARDDRVWYPGVPLLPATWLETGTADGSVAGTAADLASFARMLLRDGEGPHGRLVPAASITRMATPVPTLGSEGYGYGLFAREIDGTRYVGHPGGMVGYVAGMQCDMAAGLAAVVFQNGPGAPNEFARHALRLVRAAREGRDPVERQSPPPDDGGPEPDPGTFSSPDGRRFELRGGRGSETVTFLDAGRSIGLDPYGDGRYGVKDPAWDRGLLSFEPGGDAAWHLGDRFERGGSTVPPVAQPPDAVRAVVGHYRSHDPWTTNFRVVLRGEMPWLLFVAAPDGFDDEQPLVPFGRDGFRVGSDPLGPERLRFDTVIDGHARRAWLSGWDYYRVGDP